MPTEMFNGKDKIVVPDNKVEQLEKRGVWSCEKPAPKKSKSKKAVKAAEDKED